MESNLISKLNVYDQFGYLCVGGIALLIGILDFSIMGLDNIIPKFNMASLIVYMLVIYFFGHVIQGMANIFIKEKKSDFSEKDKYILKEAQNYFKVDNLTDSETYLLCYMLACAKDITGQVEKFNSYYSLYRGWVVIFSIETIFFLVMGIMHNRDIAYWLSLIVSLFITIIFFRRMKRFYYYSRQKVLQTYILLRSLSS